MKTFVCVVLLLAVAFAEPPRYRQARFRAEKQELAPPEREGEKEQMTERHDAPYPASGYRPQREFLLPSRQELTPPATSYGIPADSYGAPILTYTATQEEHEKPKEEEHGEKKEKKEEKGEEKKEGEGEEPKKESEEVKPAQVVAGAYYILLPDSQLQRVQFRAENDYANMAYTARLQYRNEDRAPIFVYNAVPEYQSAAYVQW